MRPAPIHQLPTGYRQVYHLVLLQPANYLRLNLFALIPLALGFLLMMLWRALVEGWRGAWPGGPGADWPWWLWLLLGLAVTIPLHEWLHGLAIRWAGHRPRYGLILSKGAFYATADDAYFRRSEYLVIALAPIAGITLLGMALIALLPDGAGFYIGVAVALNAANAIGDLWMVVVLLRYPPAVLVKDEMDSLRVYARP